MTYISCEATFPLTTSGSELFPAWDFSRRFGLVSHSDLIFFALGRLLNSNMFKKKKFWNISIFDLEVTTYFWPWPPRSKMMKHDPTLNLILYKLYFIIFFLEDPVFDLYLFENSRSLILTSEVKIHETWPNLKFDSVQTLFYKFFPRRSSFWLIPIWKFEVTDIDLGGQKSWNMTQPKIWFCTNVIL